MLKTIFLTVIKLMIAVGLIAWLIDSGKLDFSLIGQLAGYPALVALSSIFCVLNLVLVSIRWRKILTARSAVALPLPGLLKVSWIGQFFSSVLPGSVSGDLVKMLYVQNLNPDFSKRYIFASILIDRVMGLAGLILLVGISSLLFSGHILRNAPEMKPLLMINYGLALVVIGGMVLFFFCNSALRAILRKLETLFLPRLWAKLINLWDDLVSIKSRLVKCVVISIGVQFVGVMVFWTVIYPFVEGKMDFREALAFIPIGLMTLALPVAPSGLGVGHAIFQKLFQFSGIDNGASLFNLYFVITLCVNLLGVIPWFLSKKKIAAS